MKRTLINIAVLSSILGSGMVQAGGFDRTGQDTSIILKDGNPLEVTLVSVSPHVTGTYGDAVGGGGTGDVAPNYTLTTLAIRREISDNVALAVIQESPFGTGVDWTEGPIDGVNAKINSDSTTALASYRIDNRFTVYGGVKSQTISATAAVPYVGLYTISTDEDRSTGFVFGAALEKPEIGMRVALTYHSKVEHELDITETTTSALGVISSVDSTTKVESPEAYNLDFQTGIAENTLLFGSIRHAMWSQFVMRPPVFLGATGFSLKEFDEDTTSYKLGVGRKFSDQWSGAVTYGYETAEGTPGDPLGPTDGLNAYGLGVTYTNEAAKVTLAVQQLQLGDTDIGTPVPVEMRANTAIVTALKVAYKF